MGNKYTGTEGTVVNKTNIVSAPETLLDISIVWGLWVWLAVPKAHWVPEASLGQWKLCPSWILETVGGVQCSPWPIWFTSLAAI